MMSDYLFLKGTDDLVYLNTKFSSEPTYYYLYTHKGQFSTVDFFGAPSSIDFGME